MSGFEVAGVVLGSIPLLITALEHFGEGLSTIQRWRKYRRELESLILNLETERVKLQNVYEKLLIGLVPASEIEAMIDEPFGYLWRRKSVDRKIQARLWKSTIVFQNTTSDIIAAITEIKQEIDSQKDGNISGLRRGIFTLKRLRFEERLSIIRNGIAKLENFTDRNIELEPERKLRSQTKLFLVLRDISSSFHRALRTSLHCSCEHKVGLGLQSRSADIAYKENSDRIIKDLSFQLAISYRSITHSDKTSPGTVLDWQEIVAKAILTTTPTPSLTTIPTIALERTKIKKSVLFRFPPTITSTTSIARSTATITTNLVQTSPESSNLFPNDASFSSAGVALDLCEKLRQSAFDTHSTLVDQLPPSPRRYSIHPTPCTDDSRPWSVVSLYDILEQKSRFPPLSYHNRLRLAVTISSSVLQLHGTPWLPRILTSHHIFFLQKHNAPSPTMYWQPVLLQHLPDGGAQPAEAGTGIEAERNPTLLSLGCVLIEVILGRPLDSRQAAVAAVAAASSTRASGGASGGGGGGVNLMSDYVAAQGLMDEVRMKSTSYEQAVARCMDGKLHRRGCGLEDGDLCQDVYSQVVALLERDLDNS